MGSEAASGKKRCMDPMPPKIWGSLGIDLQPSRSHGAFSTFELYTPSAADV
jgi:hypothetical protein